MARPLRIQFAGAAYHLIARGNQGRSIFADDEDRWRFLKTIGETCEKTGWVIHAYVLMGNHYHLLTETPEANLVDGMKWLQGVYTQRYNWRHDIRGHLFQGRYKAVPVQADNEGYLEAVTSYIHLNPARAGLIQVGTEPLKGYLWSSYPWLLGSARRGPQWLCRTRILDALHLKSAKGYEAYLESRALELAMADGVSGLEEKWRDLRRGWYLGDDGFLETLRGKLRRLGTSCQRGSHSGGAKAEHGQQAAEKLLTEACESLCINLEELGAMRKGAIEKKAIAWRLRQMTTVSLSWISQRLAMGHSATVSHAVGEARRGGNPGLNRLMRRLNRQRGEGEETMNLAKYKD